MKGNHFLERSQIASRCHRELPDSKDPRMSNLCQSEGLGTWVYRCILFVMTCYIFSIHSIRWSATTSNYHVTLIPLGKEKSAARKNKRSELTVGLSPGQFIPTHYRQRVVPPVRTKWSSWQHCSAFSVYIARIKKCQIDGSRLSEIVRPLPRWPLVAGQCGKSSSAPFSPSPRSLTAPCVSLITSMTMICEGSQCSIANHGDLPQPTSQWKPRVAMMLTLSSLVTRRMSLWLTAPPVQ